MNKQLKYSLLVLISFVILFLILHPKVSTLLFPQKRAYVLNNFLNETKKTNNIDPQKYWEFRDFYSPGYFDFERKGLNQKTVDQTLQELGVSLNKQYVNSVFLKYNSPYLKSVDALVTSPDLETVVEFKPGQTILKNEEQLIYQDGKNLKILFVMSKDEMKRSNGFIDFRDEIYTLDQDLYWLNLTELSTRGRL